LCREAVARAVKVYDVIESKIRLDPKSNGEHLQAIKEGLRLFVQLAEIDESGA
jgi:hypothetical protein